MISRNEPTATELEDAAIADAIRGFIGFQARDWARKQKAIMVAGALRLVDEARAHGDAPDVDAIIKQVWFDHKVPMPDEK